MVIELLWVVFGFISIEVVEVGIIVVWLMTDLIVEVVKIVGMEKIIWEMIDMAVDDRTDVVEDNIVEEVGLYKHTFSNLEKVDFEFAEEAKLAKAYEHSINSK